MKSAFVLKTLHSFAQLMREQSHGSKGRNKDAERENHDVFYEQDPYLSRHSADVTKGALISIGLWVPPSRSTLGK